MLKTEPAPPTTQQARAALTAGLETQIVRLQRLHATRRIVEMGGFLAIGAAGGWCVCSPHLLPQVAGTLLLAVMLNACVLLLHEGMHQTLFANRWWNRRVAVLLGGCVSMSFTAYQVMHLRHHRYLGDPRDPDDYDNYCRVRAVVWLLHFVRLGFGSLLYLALIPFYACRHATAQECQRIHAEYRLLLGAYALLYAFVPHAWLLHFWLVPLLVVGFMTNVRGFTQHGIGEARDPYLASRSIHCQPWLAALLLHENYHLEHHLFPEVPSYHLQQLHGLLWRRLPRALVNRSYTEFMLRFLKATATMDGTPIGLVYQEAAGEAPALQGLGRTTP